MSKSYHNHENIFDYLQCHKNQQKVLKEQAEKKKVDVLEISIINYVYLPP